MSGPTTILFVIDAASVGTLEWMLQQNPTQEVHLPTLQKMGLGNLLGNEFKDRIPSTPRANLAVALEQASTSPDSLIGHSEMMGVITKDSYDLFPQGFPPEFVNAAAKEVGCQFMFNRMAGGEEAIEQNHLQHTKTADVILYASVCDPLVQLAAHVDIVPPTILAEYANRFFRFSQQEGSNYGVRITRVIARPYSGHLDAGLIRRTELRHDAVAPLDSRTLIDTLTDDGIWVAGVGKFPDLVLRNSYSAHFPNDGAGSTDHWAYVSKSDTNFRTFAATHRAIAEAKKQENGSVILVNLVDTDSKYGHPLNNKKVRESSTNWLRSLEAIDQNLSKVATEYLERGDTIFVTADHGMQRRKREDGVNDYYGFHWRNVVPFLGLKIGGGNIEQRGNRWSFTTVGRTIAYIHGAEAGYEQEVLSQNIFLG